MIGRIAQASVKSRLRGLSRRCQRGPRTVARAGRNTAWPCHLSAIARALRPIAHLESSTEQMENAQPLMGASQETAILSRGYGRLYPVIRAAFVGRPV